MLEATVEKADQTVGQGPQRLAVGVVASLELVVVGTGAGRGPGHALRVGLKVLGQGVLTRRWLGSPPHHRGEVLVLLGACRGEACLARVPRTPMGRVRGAACAVAGLGRRGPDRRRSRSSRR